MDPLEHLAILQHDRGVAIALLALELRPGNPCFPEGSKPKCTILNSQLAYSVEASGLEPLRPKLCLEFVDASFHVLDLLPALNHVLLIFVGHGIQESVVILVGLRFEGFLVIIGLILLCVRGRLCSGAQGLLIK